MNQNKVILIQGAMNIEVEELVSKLDERTKKVIAGYEFYEGIMNKKRIIISKTEIGVINATIATTIAITNFHPDIVINQGIAGGHRKDIHVGDIIIGEKCCNINAYKMPIKAEKQGSNPFEWKPNKRGRNVQYGDIEIVDFIEKSLKEKCSNKIYKGILGSGDLFSKEIDRIIWINNTFGNYCEDMESIGVYTACNRFKIPCVGVRIISNSEILLEELDESKAIELQRILINVINDIK